MIQIDLSLLVARLNPLCRHMLEEAAAFCLLHKGAEIRVEHLLLKMLETPLSDVREILVRTEIDIEELKGLLQPATADGGQAQGYPSFSPLLVEWLQDSWLLASTELRQESLRSGAMLLVLLMSPHRYLPEAAIRQLIRVNPAQLRQQFDEWAGASAETPVSVRGSCTPPQADASLLARFTHNLTEQAREGGLDPVSCREREIDQMIDILCRRRKNNPMVVGEAGVGKSALIEGLALRIVADQVPESLRGVALLSLDLGAMQAGASIKGEFERRLKGVMQEVKTASHPVILFIDEAHTLIGAGNQAGGLDVSNLIKPALARGELRTIAATTWGEYKRYVEKDAALSRRFQLVPVAEPSVAEVTLILRGLRHRYEQAHGVLIDEGALHAAAQLSARYLSGRQLPDKAIDVLDTACARVAIGLSTAPQAVSQRQSEVQQRELEIRQLARQHRIGLGDDERLAALRDARQVAQEALAEQAQRWQQQRALVQKIVALRSALLDGEPLDGERIDESQAARLASLTRELAALQQGEVLISAHVDESQIAAVIAQWTGVPLNRISQSELDLVARLPQHLGEQIRGQEAALTLLHRHLLTARADLRRPGRPQGAFLLVGPSGVGKTETVVQIAELLFGGRHYLTTINMSEYQEQHTVSRLIGSPPGYVGFGEGGVLTEAIRQKPWSVVLLDEVEKAHPDVLSLFYQAFDKGELADGEGRLIDCKNVLFFLTSNLGCQITADLAHAPEALNDALYPELAAFFKPALLARMEVIPYLPLGRDVLAKIVDDKLVQLTELLEERFGAEVRLAPEVAEEILRRANRGESGARMLGSVIDGALLPPLALQLLQRRCSGDRIQRVWLRVSGREFVAEVEG